MNKATHPLTLRAAILKMIAGLLVQSMWAAARLAELTTQDGLGPQYTLTKASWAGVVGLASPDAPLMVLRTAR